MSDGTDPEDVESSARGEAAWKEAKDKVAARNQQAQRTGRKTREVNVTASIRAAVAGSRSRRRSHLRQPPPTSAKRAELAEVAAEARRHAQLLRRRGAR